MQAKLVRVAALAANAFVLHHLTFPRLARAHPVALWTLRDLLTVAIPVGLSNGLWSYCAFLGIARAWNHTVPIEFVLQVAAAVAATVSLGVFVALRFAARDKPVDRRPDMLDTIKSRRSEPMPIDAGH